MEKNIAAFVREGVKTVGVRFFVGTESGMLGPQFGTDTKLVSQKEYTYVTNKDIKQNSLVVVWAQDTLKVALVTRVDNDVDIDPNSSVEYSWIVDTIDYAGYEELQEGNKAIRDTVRESYRKNAKEQFRSLLLSSVDEEAKNKILAITSKDGSKATI